MEPCFTLCQYPALNEYLMDTQQLRLGKYVQNYDGTDKMAILAAAVSRSALHEPIIRNLDRTPTAISGTATDSRLQELALPIAVARFADSANWADTNAICRSVLNSRYEELNRRPNYDLFWKAISRTWRFVEVLKE